MKLAFKEYGLANGQPIIILHGLYGSSDNWVQIGRQLAVNNKVYIIDQRNHGDSPHSDKHNYILMANDLLEFITYHQIKKPIIIGHSMGGKTAMFFAKQHAQQINKLIIIDISPLDYSNSEKQKSNLLSHAKILNYILSFNVKNIKTRKEADKEMAKQIPSLPMRQFILKNLKRTDTGYKWKMNIFTLKNEINEILKGINYNTLDKETFNTLPVLFIKGAYSIYILEKDVQAIKKIFPHSIIKEIPQTGHWVHAEKPEDFLNTVNDFIRK